MLRTPFLLNKFGRLLRQIKTEKLEQSFLIWSAEAIAARKVSKYGVFSGPYFPVFSPNTGQKKLRIWDTFHAVNIPEVFYKQGVLNIFAKLLETLKKYFNLYVRLWSHDSHMVREINTKTVKKVDGTTYMMVIIRAYSRKKRTSM